MVTSLWPHLFWPTLYACCAYALHGIRNRRYRSPGASTPVRSDVGWTVGDRGGSGGRREDGLRTVIRPARSLRVRHGRRIAVGVFDDLLVVVVGQLNDARHVASLFSGGLAARRRTLHAQRPTAAVVTAKGRIAAVGGVA